MNIQPIVFSVPSALQPQPQPASSGVPVWVFFAFAAIVFIGVLWPRVQVDPSPGPGPSPTPISVIREAVDGAESALRKEAVNYALAHRRLAELVRNKTIKTQSQFATNSEALMKGARENAFPPILGPLDNRHLPEKFDGKESEIANYLESLALGFERAAK